jgi:NADH dehydrogenase
MLDETWSITLIDRGEHHQLVSRLPEVVAGRIPSRDAFIPFTKVLSRRVRHLIAEVEAVDIEKKRVDTSAGQLRPDVLVIAVGTTPDFLGIPGAASRTTTLKSVADAVHIRNTIAKFRLRQPVVRIVIVGAGYTGTELAGELSAAGRGQVTRTRQGGLDVRIVSEDARLLPLASPRLSAAVERILRKRNIQLHLGQSIRRVDATGLETTGGDMFSADLVVWAGQTYVSSRIIGPPGVEAPAGKLRTDPYLRVGNGEAVFACGDVAWIFDYANSTVAPSSAQLALQEGDTVARNIGANARSGALEEYRPHVLGEALGLGGSDAVAEIGGVVITGRAAATVKRAALVRYLAGLSIPLPA